MADRLFRTTIKYKEKVDCFELGIEEMKGKEYHCNWDGEFYYVPRDKFNNVLESLFEKGKLVPQNVVWLPKGIVKVEYKNYSYYSEKKEKRSGKIRAYKGNLNLHFCIDDHFYMQTFSVHISDEEKIFEDKNNKKNIDLDNVVNKIVPKYLNPMH